MNYSKEAIGHGVNGRNVEKGLQFSAVFNSTYGIKVIFNFQLIEIIGLISRKRGDSTFST